MTEPSLPSRFEPREIEARSQAAWAAAGTFRAPERPAGKPFSLILPPPNVTGVLTLGHMLGDTVMDLLVRYHRMRGEPTLWVPSVDHAGLSTQVAVRRALSKEGVRFEDLPREEALAQIEKWKVSHEQRILEQLAAGGFSLDLSRYRYTKDPAAVRATREVFVRLYHEGLIYRAERMVNWDPRLRTAISDLEVLRTEEAGSLVYLQYPWADGSPGGLEVATVRPETIFGDVAVAVHPEDPRHTSALGREVLVPITRRPIPVITDPAIDPAFGSGALKVTPRHDLVDFEVYQRHPGLPMPPDVIDERGRLSSDWVPEELRGLDRDVGRTRTLERLRAEGYVLREAPYRHSVARSERSEAVVEPRLSTQWFVRIQPLAAPAVASVREGRVRIHPDRWTLTFYRWMESIQDWCISRQVLWGHSIPVYHCPACDHDTVSVAVPEKCEQCGSAEIVSDPDVLDTWFTSWLWPFAVFGWPEPTADLAHYYPNSVLVTGRDIMFFWVARMMMAGEHFTGRAPFSDVYFTGMLRDETGRRMSKHLGNSPDPVDVMHERGVDAMRFALLFPNPTEEDGPFGTQTLEGGAHFLTKLWNLTRFSLLNLPAGTPPPMPPRASPASTALETRWILSRWRRTVEELDRALDAFEPSRAASAVYAFVWHDLADRYVEIVKENLLGHHGEPAAREARETLLFVIERTLRLLHPFAPHLTEELWHAVPHEGDLLATARWPVATEAPADPVAELEMETVLEAVRLLRNLRAEEHVPQASVPPGWIRPAGPQVAALLERERGTLERLGHVHPLVFLDSSTPAPTGAGSRVAALGECYVERPASVPEESETLRKERAKIVALLEKTRGRLADPGFRARAPAEVVREAEEKVRELSERVLRIDEHLKSEGSMPAPP
ncbi:MAG: valine--tRNA ligase [Thermoplasmata archaeon]|nr:valine--tRNA ligase [Thermoplasmata archaeon]